MCILHLSLCTIQTQSTLNRKWMDQVSFCQSYFFIHSMTCLFASHFLKLMFGFRVHVFNPLSVQKFFLPDEDFLKCSLSVRAAYKVLLSPQEKIAVFHISFLNDTPFFLFSRGPRGTLPPHQSPQGVYLIAPHQLQCQPLNCIPLELVLPAPTIKEALVGSPPSTSSALWSLPVRCNCFRGPVCILIDHMIVFSVAGLLAKPLKGLSFHRLDLPSVFLCTRQPPGRPPSLLCWFPEPST